MIAEQSLSVPRREGRLSDSSLRPVVFEKEKAGAKPEFRAEPIKIEPVPMKSSLPVPEFINLAGFAVDPEVARALPRELCYEHELILFQFQAEFVSVAMVNTDQPEVLTFIERYLRKPVVAHPASRSSIAHAIQQAFESSADDHLQQIQTLINHAKTLKQDPEAMAQETPIVALLDQLFSYAVQSQASDMHLEPTAEDAIVRLRVDGVLHQSVTLPNVLLAPLLARIKLLAHLRIDEHLRPLDGRLTFHYHERDVAMRVAIAPTVHGEKAALRLLDTKPELLSISNLGMSTVDAKRLNDVIQKTTGLILVTGPTGSGKTSTLYSILNTIREKNLNISTIEDPVEYHLPGVNQMQVNPRVGLTFADGLRSLLRQDPDVILVGEIRDKETAQIAINAALTGHLVVATLHTNSAAAAVPRLLDMGVEPYLIASTLQAVIGQRLVRKICDHCRQSAPMSDVPQPFAALLNKDGAKPTLAKGQGCIHCRQTGYIGRTGIFEFMNFDAELRQAITQRATAEDLQAMATKQGMTVLMQDGARLVAEGQTTPAEVLRTVG